MANLIFEITINLMETLVITYLVFNYLILNKKAKLWKLALVWTLIFIEVSLFNIQEASYVVETGIQIITLLISACLLSDDYFVLKLFMPIFAYVVLYISNMITLFSASFIMGVPIQNLSDEPYFYIIIIISKTLFAVIGILLPQFRKKRYILETKRNWILIIPIIIMIWILSVNFLELVLRGVINYKLLYLSIVSLMIFCVSIYFLLEFLLKDAEKRTHELFVIQQLKYQKENMDDVRLMNEEIRRIKHDLKHQLAVIVEGLKDNKVDEMINILESSSKEINQNNIVSFTNDEMINYILQSKNKLAMQKGLRFRCEIAYEKSENIKDEDMVILLGNLLDNAIEHSTKNSEVVLSISAQKGLLHIKVKNAVEESCIDTKVTSKEDKRNHGFGMKSIYQIVNRYEGNLEEKIIDKCFIIDILLRM